MATRGLSDSSRWSHLLKTIESAGAWNGGAYFMASITSPGDFLYRSPSIFPGIPQERKYSKSGLIVSLNPRYRLPPGHPTASMLKESERPFLTSARAEMMQRGTDPGLTGSARPP